jgi:hypothetical protein
VGGKTCKVVFRTACPEVVQHQERIELRYFVTAKRPVQVYPGTFNGRVCPENPFYLTDLYHKEENRVLLI